MDPEGLYRALGVCPDASSADITRKFRKLAKELHPDKNPHCGEKFKKISYAYEILSDPEKRQLYNQCGIRNFHRHGAFEDSLLSSDLYSTFFGPRLFGMNEPVRGKNAIHPLRVTLEDLYNGRTAKLELNKNIICKSCRGIGGQHGIMISCRTCNGHGIRTMYRSMGFGVAQMQTRCSICFGTGQTIHDKDICRTCRGSKIIDSKQILKVHIEKGMGDGERIIFKGESDQYPNIEPGDVIIVLNQEYNSFFKRLGNNIIIEHKLSLVEALCGFTFVLKHLDGRELLIKNEPGNVIKPGDVKVVKGEGMPLYKNPFEKGDLHVKFDVTFPENYFQTEDTLKIIENCLPHGSPFIMPVGDHVEEVDLTEYIETKHEQDYSYEDHHYGGLQCAHQ